MATSGVRLVDLPFVGRRSSTAFPAKARESSVPLVGLSEALVLSAVRRAGVPLERVRRALEVLSSQLGVHHALASKRLFTDGAEILFDYAEASSDPAAPVARQLVVGPHVEHPLR